MIDMRLRSLIPPVVFALTGCTINTYSQPANEPPAAQPAAPAQTAATPATPRKITDTRRPAAPHRTAQPATSPAATPSTAPTSNTRPPSTAPQTDASTAPRISSPIVFGNGQSGIFKGLAYVIPPGTTKMPNLDTMVPFATLFTDDFDIKPQDFHTGFPGVLAQDENFAIRYEGRIQIPRTGGWMFQIESDDGAILYVDGVKTVDNDGVHTTAKKIGGRSLKAGMHAIRIDYFQGTGPVSLRVHFIDGNMNETPLIKPQ